MIEMTKAEQQAYLNLRSKCAYLSDMFEHIANWLNRDLNSDYYCEDDEAKNYELMSEWLGWGNAHHPESIVEREYMFVELFYKEKEITIRSE